MSAISTELGSLVLPVKAWSPAKESPVEPFVYVDLSSVDRETKEIVAPQGMTGAEAPSRARQLLKAGDVLVSTVRPNLNAVAVVPDDLDSATGSTGFCVLRADSQRLDKRYLFHWVRSPAFIASMVRRATGASYPAVSDRIVKQSKIPLPPLPKQRKIAAILDKADTVRRKRQQTLDLADQFLRSAFLDMSRKYFDATHLRELQEVSEVLLDCRNKTAPYVNEGIPLIRTSNFRNYRLDLSDLRYVAATTHAIWSSRHQTAPQDIVFAREAPVGMAAIVPEDFYPCLGQRIMVCRANTQAVRPHYLLFALNSPPVYRQALGLAVGSTVKHLRVGDVGKLLVPVPPLAEQDMFVDRYFHVERIRIRQNESTGHLDSLLGSTMQRVFRGDL